jgi:hypothetical protein
MFMICGNGRSRFKTSVIASGGPSDGQGDCDAAAPR